MKVNELEPLKSQVASLKQNTNVVKEANIKIHDLTTELAAIRLEHDKFRKENDELNKHKTQLDKSLRETTLRAENEVELLRVQLAESEQKSVGLQSQLDGLRTQLAEIESERGNHQKLIKEFDKLEQRFETVNNELVKHHKSGINGLESLMNEIEQHELKPIGKDPFPHNGGGGGTDLDLNLLTRLQKRIYWLESERAGLLRSGCTKLDNPHDNNNNTNELMVVEPPYPTAIERLQQEKDYELIKSQEFEFENQKLREELNRLRDLCADNQIGACETQISSEMMSQFGALNEECQRRREECIQLKTLLVSQHNNNRHSQNGEHLTVDFGADQLLDLNSIVTDGNEFEVGYNTQKILNRILENSNLELKRTHEAEKNALAKQIDKLREENDRQHEILMQNLAPESLAEATYKNQLMKLAEDNLVSRILCFATL